MRWDILFPLVRVRTRLIPDMQAPHTDMRSLSSF